MKNYQDIYSQNPDSNARSNSKKKGSLSSLVLNKNKSPIAQFLQKSKQLNQESFCHQSNTTRQKNQFSFHINSHMVNQNISNANQSYQNSFRSNINHQQNGSDGLKSQRQLKKQPSCTNLNIHQQNQHNHSQSVVQSPKANIYINIDDKNTQQQPTKPQQAVKSPKFQSVDQKQQIQDYIKMYSQNKPIKKDQNEKIEPKEQKIEKHSLKDQKDQEIANALNGNKPSFIYYLKLKDLQATKQIQEQNGSNGPLNSSKLQSILMPSSTQMSKNNFNFNYVIGKGGFGKVWKVLSKKDKKIYALKEMSKALVISKKSVSSVMNERQLLSELKHEFIINMFFAFHDRDNLYLVMDYMSGGDLRYHIGIQRRFTEEQTKFFIACIFSGLEYLHNKNIIHRDIKPENIVLDNQGYARITDLGIARKYKPDNENDTSGTPGYMAPEVMCRQPHSFAVDYFALGVIAYEFMLGRRPYLGRSRKEIRDQILARRVQIKKNEIPNGWSLEAADFINKLIERKPSSRLGNNGPSEVKNHVWIKNYPWEKLNKRQVIAPFVPKQQDNFDQKQQISLEDEQNAEIIQQNSLLLKRNSVQSLFNGYNFDGMVAHQKSSQLGPTGSTAYDYTTNITTGGSTSAISAFLKSGQKIQNLQNKMVQKQQKCQE